MRSVPAPSALPLQPSSVSQPIGLAWPQPDGVLIEQLRLVHANARVSFGATFLVGLLMLWVHFPASGRGPLTVWFGVVCACIATAVWLARRYPRAQEQDVSAQTMASLRHTVVVYASYGMIWGALPWLTLDDASPYEATWQICAIAAMLAGGMTFMAPVPRVFAGYALLLVLPLSVKLMVIGQPAYLALGLGSIIVLGTTIAQAVKLANTFRTMIELRFANEALVKRLRLETGNALAARAQAEAANLAKSKFLAAASHDLRQPVHAQGLFLEVLARSELTDEQRGVLANARAAGTASAEMLNTLLDFSRIEAGVVKPHVQAFRLQPLLHKIEIELAAQADTKGIVYRSRETHAVAASDAALVELILRNLVSNAIRYTEAGGVLVGCRTRGDAVDVEVWDTGIGIAPEHQQDVFREFHQLGNPERDRRKGLGLGLAIAGGLAAALGQALTLRSRAGRGSVFSLRLPLSPAPVNADAATRSGDPLRLLDLRVLVIDDDEAVRAGMAHLLRDWGAQCETAGSIDDALALARASAPQLVISDYRLREQRTGAEAIAAVRAVLGRDVPALLITGDTAPERLREAEACGVPLLHKPVLPAQLFKAMAQLTG